MPIDRPTNNHPTDQLTDQQTNMMVQREVTIRTALSHFVVVGGEASSRESVAQLPQQGTVNGHTTEQGTVNGHTTQ